MNQFLMFLAASTSTLCRWSVVWDSTYSQMYVYVTSFSAPAVIQIISECVSFLDDFESADNIYSF